MGKWMSKWNAIDINSRGIVSVVMQMNDTDIKTVMDVLLHSNKANEMPPKYRRYFSNLEMEDELLFYKHHGKRLLVAPPEIRPEILELGHAQFLSGHQGIFRTHQ